MRCPACQTENAPRALHCQACHRRLFVWLGDPFGAQEAPVGETPPPHTEAEAGFLWSKAVIAGLVLLFLLPSGVGWTLLAAAAIGGVLWRRPGLGWGRLAILLGAALIGVPVLATIGASGTGTGTRVAATATVPPAQATATARDAWNVSAIVPDPINLGAVYVATWHKGLLHLTEDAPSDPRPVALPPLGSASFVPIIGDLAFDPHDPRTLYFGRGGVLYAIDPTTGDKRRQWVLDGASVASILVDPSQPGAIYVNALQLWRTTDAGERWVGLRDRFESGAGAVQAVAISPGDHHVLYAWTSRYSSRDEPGGRSVLFKTVDSGEHWTLTGWPAQSQRLMRIAVSRADPQLLYLVPYGTVESIPRSRDGGEHWEAMDVPVLPIGIWTLVPDGFDANVVYLQTSRGIYRTANAGATWDRVYESPESVVIRRIAQQSRGDGASRLYGVIWNDQDNQLSLIWSDDDGQTWSP